MGGFEFVFAGEPVEVFQDQERPRGDAAGVYHLEEEPEGVLIITVWAGKRADPEVRQGECGVEGDTRVPLKLKLSVPQVRLAADGVALGRAAGRRPGVAGDGAAALGLAELPAPAELTALAEPWRPHRSVATWYSWKSLGPVPQFGQGG